MFDWAAVALLVSCILPCIQCWKSISPAAVVAAPDLCPDVRASGLLHLQWLLQELAHLHAPTSGRDLGQTLPQRTTHPLCAAHALGRLPDRPPW